MRLALAVLALGTLVGCSTKYELSGADWSRPGVRAARDAGHTPDLIVGGLADVGRYFAEERQRGGVYRSCMQARGYQPSGS